MSDDLLFLRRWAVEVGPPGGEGKRWEDLRVTFSVSKTSGSDPNEVRLSVYNLSEASRQFCERRKTAVRLFAGYGGNIRLIAAGEIDKSESRQVGTAWETEISAADGLTAYGAVIHESLGPNTTELAVVQAVARELGVVVGTITGLGSQSFGHGRVLSGPARYELDALCKTRGLRWSIQDGALQIYPVGSSTDAPAVLLTEATGLIGSPEKTESGYRLVSLLQGGINPGQLIEVRSRDASGIYVAQSVTHDGDSHGAPWYTDIDALRLA